MNFAEYQELCRIRAPNGSSSVKKKGKSRSGAQGIHINRDTLAEEEKGDNSIWLASRIEATVYRFLRNHFSDDEIIPQQQIAILDNQNIGMSLAWRPDFFIVPVQKYLEVKGQWINQPHCTSEKSLFIWQYLSALNLGHDILVCSDKPFQIAQITVLDYVTAVKTLLGQNND